ncbi:nucleoporin [Scheffersomyces amazonensis]|uniref:nucleoporin n=1 Tax=Scheffersomyces amazonensis TaxID=1078765 RepID=UPI00315C5134
MSSLQLRSNHIESLPLKPIQPTQFWTFDNALTLLRTCHDPYILDALDEFLLLHSKLLFNALPFHSVDNSESFKDTTKEITLRSIIYTDITSTNIHDSKNLYKILDLNGNEILRVISQSYKRNPEFKTSQSNKLKSKLPDDRAKNQENKRLIIYTRRILKERRLILKIVNELLNNKTNSTKSRTIQNLGKELYLSSEYLIKVIQALKVTIESIISKSYITGISKQLDDIIYCENILFAIELCKVTVDLVFQNPRIENKARLEWFKLMNNYSFGAILDSYIEYNESLSILQSLMSIISIQFLDLDNSYDTTTTNQTTGTTFVSDVEVVKQLHDYISSSIIINPTVLYSWLLILLRKLYFIQEFPTIESSHKFIKSISIEELDSYINELSNKCAKLDIFGHIKELSQILKFNDIYAAILSGIIISSLPVITINDNISDCIASVLKLAPNSIITKFFDNESSINAIILARAKFPIQITPYLKLASINGNFALEEFNELKSYIHLFNREDFLKSHEIDQDNTDLVKLSQLIDVYPPYESNKKISFMFDKGTKAKILPSSNPNEVLVTFLYKYSGWALLGRVLQNTSKLFGNKDHEKLQFIINILQLLISVVKDNSNDEIKQVLDSMSAYTEDSDIIEVILRLLEQGLHARNVEVITLVIDLLTQLMPIYSYRIWPCLAKSSLLSHDGKEGIISTIFGSIEMNSGEYKLTTSIIYLTDTLVENCLSLIEDYPLKSKSIILSKFIQHLLLVFESSTYCKFKHPFENLQIGVLSLDIFSNILAAVHSINSINKVTNVFGEAANIILESFLVTSEEYARSTSPILQLIKSFPDILTVYEINDISGFWYDNWIRCSLTFSQLIIRIRSNLNSPPSAFEIHLFTLLPNLVAAYSQFDTYRKEVLDLITCLTNGKWEKDKPSLLSHLGEYYSQVLFHSVAVDLDNSFDDYKIKVSLYDFICAVMGGDQEGLSVLFLSGRDVFGDFTNTPTTTTTKKNISLLQIMKKNVRDMKYYPNSVSLPLVDAISLTLNSWTAGHNTENDNEFINELINRLTQDININGELISSDDYLLQCYELKLASKIAEVLSLYLFTSKNQQINDIIFEFMASDKFSKLAKNKFIVSGYRPSLQTNVQTSFTSLFPQFELYQFTSTLNKRNRFGISTLYNLPLMDNLFHTQTAWTQLREQVIASSINLQYLDAQISSSKSFGALITSYCRKFNGPLSLKLLDFVIHLLNTNINEGLASTIFEEVYQERIELAFYLFYSLYSKGELKNKSEQIFEVIKYSLDLLSSSSMNFLPSLASSRGYYRSLLKIIYCALSLIQEDSGILIEYLSIFRDLFELIFTKGTRTLLIELQNEVYLSKSSGKNHKSTKLNDKIDDLMIILSILKVFVNMKSSLALHNEMALLVEENETIKALLNLYSFSHTIEVNDEHIFAQLSLMFIQELMSFEIIAEKCINSGLFVVLVESSISKIIKNGNLSESNGGQYHALWTNGILPIIIISLSKLGSSILPEICVALQLFSKQIESCIQSWSEDSSSIRISTSTVAETSQIILILELLKSLNVTAYLNDGNINNNDIDIDIDIKVLPGLESESKREEFIQCISNLLKHPKFLTSRVVPSSSEERRIIEAGGEVHDKFVNDLINEIRSLKEYLS